MKNDDDDDANDDANDNGSCCKIGLTPMEDFESLRDFCLMSMRGPLERGLTRFWQLPHHSKNQRTRNYEETPLK
jgi:hypothetical protein